MANMSSISCATTCGRRLPVSARKGSRAAPSATRDGASYPQYAFQAAAISGFTSRITRQLIGRATERAAAAGALMSALGQSPASTSKPHDKHFERGHVGQQLIVAASFEPIIQRSVGSSPKLAFKAALATQPGKTACARSRNDRAARLDLAILDDF